MTAAVEINNKRSRSEEADNASTSSSTKKVKKVKVAKLGAVAYRKEHAIELSGDGCDAFEPIERFKDVPFSAELKQKFKDSGFAAPTPIQAQCWPILLEGKDLVGVAKTGSGKTLGFLLPALHTTKATKGPRILVLAPTRELAMQINNECNLLKKNLNFKFHKEIFRVEHEMRFFYKM